MKIRNALSPSQKVAIDFRKIDSKTGEFKFHPGRTKQADKDGCDINNILKRYEQTGVLPDLIKREPRYGDFSSVPSYQESLDIVHRAETQFAALSAEVRDRFGNDPVKMLEFCQDEKNLPEMVKLGLAIEKEKPKENAPEGGQNNPAT